MATLTLNINQKAQMAAKAAYDKELTECLAEGINLEGAEWCAQLIWGEARGYKIEKKTGV